MTRCPATAFGWGSPALERDRRRQCEADDDAHEHGLEELGLAERNRPQLAERGRRCAMQAEHALVDGHGRVQAVGAEHDPGQHHAQEGHEPAQHVRDRPRRSVAPHLGVPEVVDHQEHAVQRAPDHEGPGGAVPEAAQQHREEQVQVAPGRPLAVAAQRHVEIVAQEVRQRDVPAPPEFDDVGRLVGRAEIQRKLHAQAQRQADRHVRIAREVEIDLQRVGERAEPCGVERGLDALVHAVEHHVGVLAHRVGDQQLLGEAEGEDRNAERHLVGVEPVGGRIGELRHHLRVVQHRARDQVRKVGDEQHVVDEAALMHLALPAVDQEGDLREGVERDADRQHDVQQRDLRQARRGQPVVHVRDEEVGVLEDREHAQVDHQRQHQQRLALAVVPLRRGRQAQPEPVVDADRRHQQRQRLDAPPAVEEQRGQGEKARGGPGVALADQEEPDQYQREEDKNEGIRIEKHRRR